MAQSFSVQAAAVIVRDRKDPREREGDDQNVP